jgi:ABC-2 type transport system permease protein
VWLSGLVPLEAIQNFVMFLPPELQALPGMPVQGLFTYAGRLSLAYVDPVVVFTATAWSISRGSDSISGEVGRGTMEMVLAQPVPRLSVLISHAGVTLGGAAVLALATWLGTCVGILVMETPQVTLMQFLPASINVFGLMVFLAGVTTLFSSWDTLRWRTIGLVGSFYALSLVVKIVARTAPHLGWMINLSFLGCYDPQIPVVTVDRAWSIAFTNNGILIGLGLAAYVAAGVVFCRRDIPAPV